MTERELLLDLHMRIVGDGTENNPGLDKRVDRAESFIRNARWVITTAVACIIGLLIERAKRFIGGA